jgi:hypothetical protein
MTHVSQQVATRSLITSPVFLVKGQVSRWRYPDPRLTPEDAEKLRNINKSVRGTAATREGYSPYLGLVLPDSEAVTGFREQQFTGIGLRQVFAGTTRLYALDGTSLADITDSVLTGDADDRIRFSFLHEQMVINNGVDQIRLWDGVIANDVEPIYDVAATNPAPFTSAMDVVAHKGVLVVLGPTEGGTEWPTLIRWCDLDRRTHAVSLKEWPENNRTFIYEGGSAIVGAVDSWGKLWVFKRDGVYSGAIDMHVGYFEYKFGEEIRGFRPISKMSLVARPDFIFGAAEEGAFVLSRDGQIRFLTESVDDEWRMLNRARLSLCQAWVSDEDKQVRLAVSSAVNLSGYDLVFVWDWESDEVWFDEYTDVMNFCREITAADGSIKNFLGSSEGELFVSGAADGMDNGTAFSWEVSLAPNDLGSPGTDKLFHTLKLYLREKTGQQLIYGTVELNQGLIDSRTFNMQTGTTQYYNTGLIYNSGLVYEGGRVQNKDFWINRIAKNISPRFRGSEAVELLGYSLQYEPLEG